MDIAQTTYDSGLGRRLATAVVVSVIAHLALGVALIRTPGLTESPPVFDASLPPPTAEEPAVMPGIEASRAVTINWLGFTDPDEHRAEPSDIEQAALSPEAPGAPQAVQPTELAEIDPAEAKASEPTPAEAPSPPVSAMAASGAEIDAPAPPLLALRTSAADLPSSPLIKIVTRNPASKPAPETPAVTQAEAAPAAPAAGAAPGEPKDAIPSEKEASPTSKDKPIDWHPGRPPAAEGLDITTVNPRFSITTRLAALPRNPVVRIDFRKSGTVARAEFLPGLATGYADVDGPLLDALYRWTAKGKALEALPVEDANAVVSFKMRIVLIPSPGPVRRPPPDR